MPDTEPLAFEFAAPVLRDDGPFHYHVLPLPREVADAFRRAGVRRLAGTLNGHPVRRAIQGRAGGGPVLILGRDLLRTIGADEGATVVAHLAPDPEPDRIELGPEFEAALEQDEAAAARFFAMTPGRQRSLASHVTGAKRPETRVKRALELAHKLRTHTLYGDLNPER